MPTAKRKRTRREVSPAGRFFRLFWITCAVAVSLFIGNGIARPHLFCEKQKGQIAEIRGQIRRIAGQNAKLRAEIERLRTTQGSLEEARRQGWVEPGETPLLLTDPPADGD